jgi:hypothetical protein
LTPVLYQTPVPQPIGPCRGYGHKQKTDKCLTILRIVSTLSKRPHTYTQLRQATKIHRNILRRRLDELISKEMTIRSKEYSFRGEGKGRKRGDYYRLNLDHPIVAAVLNKESSKTNNIEQISNPFSKSDGKSTGYLYDNTSLVDNKKESNLSPTRRPLVQPTKDHNPNVISKQYEYLIEDIKHFVENFIKHYYPPEKHRPYYARAIWLFRQLFKQYASNRHHRDLHDWSEIYLANKGLHPSGKSAKEVSARYGEKIRRYNKYTGEPIYGRKGISKKYIQKKSLDMANFLQEFHRLIPIFMLNHMLFQNKKEKLIVDHLIDRKKAKDNKKR